MRKIKFRAWNKFDKTMNQVDTFDCVRQPAFYYHPLLNPCEESNNPMFIPMQGGCRNQKEHPFILMQYTGLKDKKRKEIYEGDIVEIDDGDDWVIGKGKVIFKNGCFIIKDKNVLDKIDGRIEKVIGNIYENPELLKDTKEST